MYKIHSPSLTKESAIALGLAVTIVLLIIVNLLVLLPALMSTYAPTSNQAVLQEPINTQIVNEALTIIEESSQD